MGTSMAYSMDFFFGCQRMGCYMFWTTIGKIMINHDITMINRGSVFLHPIFTFRIRASVNRIWAASTSFNSMVSCSWHLASGKKPLGSGCVCLSWVFDVFLIHGWCQSQNYPPVNWHRTCQIGVGRLVSTKNRLCSGSMLIYQRVKDTTTDM